MITVDNDRISVARGDTGDVSFLFYDGTTAIPFPHGTYIFGVKKNMWRNEYLIRSTVIVDSEINMLSFPLTSEDTDLTEDVYSWGLRRLEDETVDTYVAKGFFTVKARVVHEH